MVNPFDRPMSYFPCMEDILYWVAEREQIRQLKGVGVPAPWTQDPILQKYRFCNVRRRDDRMSQWLINNIYNYVGPEDDLWFVSTVARYINWPPTLIALLVEGALPALAQDFDPHLFVEVLDKLKESGVKLYGSAYMTYPAREKGSNKAETIAYRFLLPLVEGRVKIREVVASNRVDNVVNEISRYFGWSTFMAGQVAADLTYYPMELGEAEDLYDYAPMGPGSQRGLNRLLDRSLNAKWYQTGFNEELKKVWVEITSQLDLDEFTLHDAQNCMCEMDKYWRVIAGEGSPRSIYTPETAY